MKKTVYTITVLLISSLVLAKAYSVLKIEGAVDVDKLSSINAQKEYASGEMKISFSNAKYSVVFVELPRPDVNYWDGKTRKASQLINLTLPENTWSGYERLKFDYFNPGKTDIDLKVWIIDATGYVAGMSHNKLLTQIKSSETGDITEKQMGEIPVKIKPGKGTATIDLTKEILTLDKKRAIDLYDVRAIAFVGGSKEFVVSFDNVRLEGETKNAGSLPQYPFTVFCEENPGKGYHDKRANLCPWCGDKIDNAEEVTHAEKAKKIIAADDVTIGPFDWGGKSSINTTYNRSQFNSIYYFNNGVNDTMYLDFNIDGSVPQDFKKAELRMLALYKVEIPRITSAVKVFSISAKYDINENNITWTSQPPVEELLAVSGNYLVDNSKQPVSQWYVFDITEYVKKALKKKQNKLGFKVQGWTTMNTYRAESDHYIRFCAKDDPIENRRPHIYIE